MNEYDSSEDCFKLRQQFREHFDDDAQPSREEIFKGQINSPSAVEGKEFRFGSIRMVGHGKVTNEKCGTFSHFLACSRVELHSKMMFDKAGCLVNMSGKADVHPVFCSCGKPSCPVCYERGWAVREADNINFRLGEGSKRFDHVAFGDVEHIIVSVDPKDYSFDEVKVRRLVLKGLDSRGVVGGCIISHFARFEFGTRGWHLGVHYHVLGFVRGGMRKCRGCSHGLDKGSRFFCKGCSGFYGRSKECFAKDRLIVEVKDRRKSVFGTAWYQLHHATFDVSKKRSHVVTWFGVCSYRRLKIDKALRKAYDMKRKPKCRICGSVMVRHEYCGRNPDVLAFFRRVRGSREKVERFYDLAVDYVERPEVRKWGSGSYE
jgi:hypothetical protein